MFIKPKSRIYLLLLAIIISLGAKSNNKELIKHRTYKTDTATYRYCLYIPPQMGVDEKLPLVVNLHYAWRGNLPEFYADFMVQELLIPGLKTQKAIVLAPDCPGKSWKDEISREVVYSLIEKMIEEFNIDTSRIIMSGFSLGAIGCWNYLPDFEYPVAAGIIMAGPAPKEEYLETIPQIPICIIHGNKDELFPYTAVRKTARLLRKRGLDARYMEVDGAMHYEVIKYTDASQKAIEWVMEKLDLRSRVEDRRLY